MASAVVSSRLDLEQKFRQWGEGPWLDEPDWIEWRELGLQCLARRLPLGVWGGYVGVPSSHPWHGRYPDPDVLIHGGLTFAGRGLMPAEEDLWWLGFDCGHCFDVTPYLCHELPGYAQRLADMVPDEFTPRYRDAAYVQREVHELARQAHQAGMGRGLGT